VRVSHARLVDDVLPYMPFGWHEVDAMGMKQTFSLIAPRRRALSGEASTYRLFDQNAEIKQTPMLRDALEELGSRMQIYVAEMAEERVFLHAGVVGWKEQAIVLPGRSYAGKTTLVRELVRAGATYYSDEYAVLDREGFVHPFARPLGIRVNGLNQEKHHVETLGGRAGTDLAPVGLVVLTQYRARARWRPERLSRGQALLEVLNHAIPARRRPATVMETLERVVACALVVRSPRGEGRTIVPRILSLMEDYGDPSGTVS
ncbi:MAG TPA: hypothetical protein VF221_16505, partial [Chloroflexota bacterium]